MMRVGGRRLWTRSDLADHLRAIGLGSGDDVMVHAAMRRIGAMLNGPDALIGALRDVVGDGGTLLCYVDWDACYEDIVDHEGRVPDDLKSLIPAFDTALSRANRDHGIFAEFFRTTPGAVRSGNPGASVAALGARAAWYTADHPLDYGYGDASPFAKLAAAGGKVLLAGAPLDTMTLLHHAEHRAHIPGKRVRRIEVPLRRGEHVEWRVIEEFETGVPIVDGLADDYFATIVDEFLATGQGARACIGSAPSVLVEAQAVTDFTVAWLERRCG